MNFVFSHVFREGNTCADLLANHGINIDGMIWWDSIPSFLHGDFLRNRIGFPFYRFR